MKLLKNHRHLIVATILLLIVLICLLFQISPKAPPSLPPIPTPTPEIAPTLALTPASQKLTVNWNNLSLQIPASLPSYTITSPLIDDSAISAIASALGFSEADQKTTIKSTSKLYTKDNLSLFASTAQNQISFTTVGNPPTRKGLSTTILEQKASDYLNRLFPDQTFSKISTEYFFAKNTETYPELTQSSRANLVRFSYQQILNDYPLLTTAPKNAIINLTFDSTQTLRSLEISGGFQKTQTGSSLPILDFAKLQIQTPSRAILTSLSTTVDNQSLITNQLSVVLDLSAAKLVYFVKSDNRQIIPSFLLTGTLKGNFSDTPATYLVPAYR